MKILVIQLARLGDIYQTWPVIRALRRQYGTAAKIDLLTRERFSLATKGLSEVSDVFTLNSKLILGEVFCDQPQIQSSVDQLFEFTSSIKAIGYDRLINLSFSTFSSFLVEALASDHSKINGLTRFSDGYLCIPDEVSSYFFAQVGVGLSNRIHVTDLFAQTAEVELQATDFGAAKLAEPKKQIIVHIGASNEEKRFSNEKWRSLISALCEKLNEAVILIGASEEAAIGEYICGQISSKQLINKVGQTTLVEAMDLISESSLLIGADSAPIHMAALTQTPVFNFSFDAVNFWETGPRSAKSQIYKIKKETEMSEELFLAGIESILFDESIPVQAITLDFETGTYIVPQPESKAFGWQLNTAIYMGGELPYISDPSVRQAFLRLCEANQVALEQINFLKKDPKNKIALSCLEQVDQIFSTIEKLAPEVSVLNRWVRTEKLRIAPGDYLQVMDGFERVHLALDRLLKIYPLENWYKLKNGVLNDKDILDEA